MLTKTVLGGLAAKVALGIGVATAGVTAAGAADVLPDPAQEVVASVVSAATPFRLPEPSDVTPLDIDDTDATTTTTTSTTVAGGDEDATDGTGGTGGRTANHGACVSAAARDKSADGEQNHGKTVSSVARSDCGKTGTGTPTSTTSTTVAGDGMTTSSSSTTTTVDDGQRSANSGRGNSGNSGNGNGGNSGSGSGNSGRGNPGRN